MRLIKMELFTSRVGDAGVAMGVAMYDDDDQEIVWNVNLEPSGEIHRYWGHYFRKEHVGWEAASQKEYEEKVYRFRLMGYGRYLDRCEEV